MRKTKALDSWTRVRATVYLLLRSSPAKAFHILKTSRRPVIIGGCARSGTTLLLSILSCHPRLFGIAAETVALCPDGYGRDGMYNKSPDLDKALELWKIYQHLIAGGYDQSFERWCEKTPRNVLYFERILQYFGDQARLIHIVRDGRDVVTSRHPIDPSRFWTTPDRWVQDVSAGRSLQTHAQVFTIRYEDLLRNYQQSLDRICQFLGIEFAQAFLDYPETAKVKESLAWHDHAGRLSTRSIGRWQKPEYAERVEELLREPGATELLSHYGYLDATT